MSISYLWDLDQNIGQGQIRLFTCQEAFFGCCTNSGTCMVASVMCNTACLPGRAYTVLLLKDINVFR